MGRLEGADVIGVDSLADVGSTAYAMATRRDLDETAQASLMPMGGPWLTPEDVSNTVAFLASDDASSITGTAMSVDRGGVNK